MSKYQKLMLVILMGRSDANIAFEDLRFLVKKLGFAERIRGDHHIYTMAGVEEILNLQPNGAKAKPFQVKQVRDVILKYRMAQEE